MRGIGFANHGVGIDLAQSIGIGLELRCEFVAQFDLSDKSGVAILLAECDS